MVKKGFTLIELLVVMAIIAILAAMLMPALARARSEARKSVCKSHEHDIGVGYTFYRNVNSQEWPLQTDEVTWADKSAELLGTLFPEYVGSLGIFDCPSGQAGEAMYRDMDADGIPEVNNSDYVQDDDIETGVPMRVVLGDLNADEVNHRGRNVVPGANLLCADTSVHWSEAPQGSTAIPNPHFLDKDPDVYEEATGMPQDASLEDEG